MSTPDFHLDERSDSSADPMEIDEALQGGTTNLSQIELVTEAVKNADDDRTDNIDKGMEENLTKVAKITTNRDNVPEQPEKLEVANGNERVNLLRRRKQEAVAKKNGAATGSSPVFLYKPKANTVNVNDIIRPAELPKVDKIPRYTTWKFLKRNQLMTEDQSIVGHRRIYYDNNAGEALICSDSEEDVNNEEGDKKEFGDSEDNLIQSSIEMVGSSDDAYGLLGQHLSRKPCEVKARYEDLVCRQNAKDSSKCGDTMSSFLDKNLEQAMDSFDVLFCRRCFIFDCKLHGCSQEVIYPAERRYNIDEELVSSEPCGPHCYLHVKTTVLSSNARGVLVTKERSSGTSLRNGLKSQMSEKASESRNSDTVKQDEFVEKSISKQVTGFETWKTLEKCLFEKGQEMFGKNSCLIVRNLMSGLKTCVEVFNALQDVENKGGEIPNSQANCSRIESSENKGTAPRTRSNLIRRKNRVRRLKFTRVKSVGSYSMRKRIVDKSNLNCTQYNPCGCLSICKDDCPCYANGTTCEKFCGCPKNCGNHYKGCFCWIGQCRTKKCPCFAANRECDPDVCRNCWVSCGDSSVVKKGENFECDNMKILLGQHQRILLGKSDVSGWGAFVRNDVSKDEYLGEYTGELISHHEADRRGKIYDRENCSYLFNLNDQYVLDANRMGNKLKFANHSPNPNCYAKIMLVVGDHRVGIYAKENIKAGEELFYDYRYEHDKAPSWAKRPGEPDPRNDDGASSPSVPARKLA